MKKLLNIIILQLTVLLVAAQNFNIEWAKGLVGDGELTPWSVAVDPSGNVITAGYFSGTADFNPGSDVYNLTSAGYDDIFIQKLDENGEFLWAIRIGDKYGELCNDVALDTDGNIYITGNFSKSPDFDPVNAGNNPVDGSGDAYVAKYSADGDFMWLAVLKKLDEEYDLATHNGFSITVDSNGDVIATGYFQGPADFDPGAGEYKLEAWGPDCFIWKLSGSGEFIWAKNIYSYGDVEGQTIKTDAANNIYIAGGFDEYAADFDPGTGEYILEPDDDYFSTGFLLKLNSDGDFKWAIKPGGSADNQNYELKRPIAIDNKGNVVLSYTIDRFFPADLDPSPAEAIFTTTGGDDIFIQKLDSLGNLIWAKQIGGEDDDLVRDILVDVDNNIYLAGKFYNEMDFDPNEGLQIVSKGWSVGDIPFILKLNEEGEYQSVYTIENPNEEWSTGTNLDLAINADGSIVCSGYMYDSSFDFGANGTSLVIQGNDDYSGFVYKLAQSGGTGNKSIEQMSCSVYPSPVEKQLYINLGDEFRNASISIYSATGSIRFQKDNCTDINQVVDVSHFEKGMYFIEIRSGSKRESGKIIKL